MTVRKQKSSLAKVGVELISWNPFQLRCKICGRMWVPIVPLGRRFPRGWWKCPNKSDHPLEDCQ